MPTNEQLRNARRHYIEEHPDQYGKPMELREEDSLKSLTYIGGPHDSEVWVWYSRQVMKARLGNIVDEYNDPIFRQDKDTYKEIIEAALERNRETVSDEEAWELYYDAYVRNPRPREKNEEIKETEETPTEAPRDEVLQDEVTTDSAEPEEGTPAEEFKGVNVAQYNEALAELRNDLKSTVGFFTNDSKEFKSIIEYMDAVCGVGNLDERQLKEVFGSLKEGVEAYQEHADRSPKARENVRINARLEIMEKITELADSFENCVSDPKESYMKTAADQMLQALYRNVAPGRYTEDQMKDKFLGMEAYSDVISGLSIYKLDRIAKDPEEAKKTVRTVFDNNKKMKAKANGNQKI